LKTSISFREGFTFGKAEFIALRGSMALDILPESVVTAFKIMRHELEMLCKRFSYC
jgi:hypothetical protein